MRRMHFAATVFTMVCAFTAATTAPIAWAAPASVGNSHELHRAQPPDEDGPNAYPDLFPCNEVHDGETMKWRGAWWKCDVVIDAERKWQWEYWGNQDPNLA